MWKSLLLWVAKALGRAAIEKVAERVADPTPDTRQVRKVRAAMTTLGVVRAPLKKPTNEPA